MGRQSEEENRPALGCLLQSRQLNYNIIVDETISAAEANRRRSTLLRGVRQGRSYVVTSHGRPVARIVPANEEDKARAAAPTMLMARLRKQPAMKIGRWTRNELYEDEA
jgi:prevent-host-death family protein